MSLLTNNGPLVEAHLAELAPELVPLFGDDLHTSSFYGARKPDPLVFANMLAHYGVPADQVFFVDDLRGQRRWRALASGIDGAPLHGSPRR